VEPFDNNQTEQPQQESSIQQEAPVQAETAPEHEITINEPVKEETNVVPQQARNDSDDELEQYLSKQSAKIKVVGTGGGGNNTITRVNEVGIVGAEAIAINTDAQDLLYTNADKKLLIGRDVTKGMGAGSDPRLGEEAARENEGEIKRLLQGADMTFVTCGMGGGTGTGSAPVIAEVSKKLGALTVGIVTMPFAMEGNTRYDNASYGLERLEQSVDTLIVIPNDKLLELAPDLPLHTAFKVADEILTNAVKGIAELVTRAGLVNLDFADIRTIMKNGGVALIGVGESDTDNRALEAVEKAISNPLLDVDITGANGALINVAGGEDMTLDEARRVVEAVSERLSDDAKIIWGAQVYKDLDKTIRTMLIVTGVKSSQIFGKEEGISDKKKKEIEKELGIEFV
jgi:cell division protein FtsZ